jgi:hypothetical protein
MIARSCASSSSNSSGPSAVAPGGTQAKVGKRIGEWRATRRRAAVAPAA